MYLYIHQEKATSDAVTRGIKAFPRGTVKLHACQLFPTQQFCTTVSLVQMYIDKIVEVTNAGAFVLALTDVGTYSATNTAFTDAFSGDATPAPHAAIICMSERRSLCVCQATSTRAAARPASRRRA